MGASIECRVPFLDYRLIEGLGALPSKVLFHGRQHKPLLRAAVGHRLSDEVLHHKKWGFGVPWGKYLRTIPAFRARVASLPEQAPIASGPFDRKSLRRIVAEFQGSESQHNALVVQLFMIASWHEATFQHRRQPANRMAAALR